MAVRVFVMFLVLLCGTASAYDCNRITTATQAAQANYQTAVLANSADKSGNNLFAVNPAITAPASQISCAGQIQSYFSSISAGSWFQASITQAVYAGAVNYFSNLACGEVSNIENQASSYVNGQINKVPTIHIPTSIPYP